ncbi:hypothetical protein [Cohnella kolymensis]|uniref:hypothetical protein n=1 Tax=Cohnella kolymensis TaxID=1590652 RepID=UPI0038996272
MENSEFSVPSPKDGKDVDFLVWGAKNKIKPHVNGSRISFTVTCNASASYSRPNPRSMSPMSRA